MDAPACGTDDPAWGMDAPACGTDDPACGTDAPACGREEPDCATGGPYCAMGGPGWDGCTMDVACASMPSVDPVCGLSSPSRRSRSCCAVGRRAGSLARQAAMTSPSR